MADHEVVIDVKSRADTSGLDRSSASANNLGQQVNQASQKAEMLGKVLRGFGYAAIIKTAVDAVRSLHEWLGKSAREAEALSRAQERAADAASVRAKIAAYKDLAKSIGEANAQLSRQAELEGLLKGGQRAAEDAASAAQEAAEIAALPQDDPDRAGREAVIRAQYARQRGTAQASRKREDIQLQRQALEDQAATGQQSAADMAALLPGMQAEAARLRGKADADVYRARSKRRMNLWTGNWQETDESTDIASGANEARQQADKLEQAIRDLTDKIAAAQGDAAFARQKAGALTAAYDAAGVTVQTADRIGGAAVGAAQGSVSAARAKRDADARALSADIAERERAMREAGDRAGGAQADIDSMRGASRREDADGAAVQARIGETSLRMRGSGSAARDRALAPLLAELDRETAEARAASAAAAAAIPQLSKIFAEESAAMRRLAEEIKTLKSRQQSGKLDTGNID